MFRLSFWRHPFTAEDPLVSKWCNAKLLQNFSDEETHLLFGWSKSECLQLVFILGWTLLYNKAAWTFSFTVPQNKKKVMMFRTTWQNYSYIVLTNADTEFSELGVFIATSTCDQDDSPEEENYTWVLSSKKWDVSYRPRLWFKIQEYEQKSSPTLQNHSNQNRLTFHF